MDRQLKYVGSLIHISKYIFSQYEQSYVQNQLSVSENDQSIKAKMQETNAHNTLLEENLEALKRRISELEEMLGDKDQ